jgi:hypothetical protein
MVTGNLSLNTNPPLQGHEQDFTSPVVAKESRPQRIRPSTKPRVLFKRLQEQRPEVFEFARQHALDKGVAVDDLDSAAWRTVLEWMATSERRGSTPAFGANQLRSKDVDKRDYREKKTAVQEGRSPSYILGIARDHAKRFFLKPGLTKESVGPNKRSFINTLIKNISPNSIVYKDDNNTVTAREYFQWITNNKPLSGRAKKLLYKMSEGHGNKGPGMGPFSERRAGYTLSLLADAGLIKNFWICGDAGSPLSVKDMIPDDMATREAIDYGAHEEAMAVDLIAHLNESYSPYEYAAMQIKSNGTLGFKESKRFLSFDKEQKQEFINLFPDSQDLFIENKYKKETFFLPVYRNVFHIPMNDRKIAKTRSKDHNDDIANLMMAAFEFMHKADMTIKLDQPYQTLSYAQRVEAMINSGGLRLNFDFAQHDRINSHADQRKSA